jgi:hypothetical protein
MIIIIHLSKINLFVVVARQHHNDIVVIKPASRQPTHARRQTSQPSPRENTTYRV